MPIDSTLRPWWLEPLSTGRADLAAIEAGLSSAQAKLRLARFGPNLFRGREDKSLLVQFLSRFKNPLVLILLVASAISAFTGEVTNFLIITGMVLFSVTLDFVQEHRANAAAEKLRQSVSVRTLVMRDGKPLEVPVTEVVPGDLVVLSAGDMIPADGRVLEAHDFFVKQALLTGESYPVEKRPGRYLPPTPPISGGRQRGVHGHHGHQRQRPDAGGQDRDRHRDRRNRRQPYPPAASRPRSRSAPAASAC